MTHSFLLIGQSNMAGRGFLAEATELDTQNGRIQVLRNGRWQSAYRPISTDRSFAGSCLAEDFAVAYAKAHPDVNVGLIPCADGGTSLSQWAVGGLLFDNAVNCARLAMRTSTLRGILWHQGESDCTDEDYPLYRERLTAILNALEEALGVENIPILLGGLGDFLVANTEFDYLKNYTHINRSLADMASADPYMAFVSAEGLAGNPDNLHFSAAALREFGLRYYAEYEKIATVAKTSTTEADAPRSKMELL